MRRPYAIALLLALAACSAPAYRQQFSATPSCRPDESVMECDARISMPTAIAHHAADRLECQMQGSMAGAASADHSLLGLDAWAWSSHVFNQCMQLKALRDY